ncbi:MAG: aspartyl/asparaginyl beta-hydroxylase domain-containing protein [Pseudomonadales bacterium]|nr:aspartyl/asparaginyl beta-hydroxylase domain-containing protein [Pseudomonadales bacterium]
MAIIISLLGLYIFCVTFVRRRSANPFPLTRQLSDFSTFMVPFNLPAYFLSKLPTTATVDPKLAPELAILKDNWEVIRDEALALWELGHIDVGEDLPGSSFYRDNRWKSFYLKLYDHDIPSAKAMAPKTMALIEQVPGMNLALFAVLMPGKQINKHQDPFAYTLRYSLGLSTPNSEDCYISINDEKHTWRDGEAVLFDETYMHYATNKTDMPRIILMTDIDRPLKILWVQKFYAAFGSFFNGLFLVDNVDQSINGIGNKLGKGLNAYKAFLKSFKKKNKPAYIASKVIIIGGLLLWIASKII